MEENIRKDGGVIIRIEPNLMKHLKNVENEAHIRKLSKDHQNNVEIVVSSQSKVNKIITPERLNIIYLIRNKQPNSVSQLARELKRTRTAVIKDLEIMKSLNLIKYKEKIENGKLHKIPQTYPWVQIQF
jgi:predicted transcriptional regulator